MQTPTIDQLVDYLAETKQYPALISVQNQLAMSEAPLEFAEIALNAGYMMGGEPPTLEEQIESPDFAYWSAVAAYTSNQGFWPMTVVQELETP